MRRDESNAPKTPSGAKHVSGMDPREAGAAKRIRTPDPRITNALLYQLSYCGVFEAGGILTRSITRRKTGIAPCDIAQGLGEGKYHVLLAAVQFGGHFPAPLPQLGYHALHQNLWRRGPGRHADRFDPLEPFAA